MLTKSRIKSLLSSFFSSSPVSKPVPPSLLSSLPPKFNLLSNSNPKSFKISTSLPIKPTMVPSESSSIFSIWRRCLQSKAVSSSGSSSHSRELCGIVGPTLSGKTTTILRSVQSEREHGSHGGLVDEGWECFSSMEKDYGIQPRGKHYAAMVDLLGRSGRLQEAYEFVLNSPCKEHSVIWGALLGACKIHGDMDLIKLAANRFFELQPANAGKYVVLCNAYATSGFWDSVAQVRDTMRESGIMKEPACSRIEVQGEVHLFLMGDSSHTKFEELRETIIRIMWTIKDSGYTPNISEH